MVDMRVEQLVPLLFLWQAYSGDKEGSLFSYSQNGSK